MLRTAVDATLYENQVVDRRAGRNYHLQGDHAMETALVLQLVGGMTVVTYLPRLIPILLLSGKRLPTIVEQWLGYVPAAIMGALLCASLQAGSGEPAVYGFSLRSVLAALPTGFVAMRYRNIMATVVVGVVAAMLMRALIPS